MGIKIEKTSRYLPPKIWTNYDFEKILETSNEWITNRTGISKRHFVENENLIDLVLNSVENLKLSNEDKSKVKVILVASCTSKYQIPNLASYVQGKFFEEIDILALDINLACSGFVSGLKIMDSLLEDDEYGILIGAEIFSEVLDFQDRNTAILFGDGSGACLISKNKEEGLYRFGLDGNSEVLNYTNKLEMEGRNVYKFSIDRVPKEIKSFLKENKINIEEIDHFIFHQANIRIIETIARKLKVDMNKFSSNLKDVGNLSSASIPVLLSELNDSKKLKRGENLLFVGFGAGLSWALSYIKW